MATKGRTFSVEISTSAVEKLAGQVKRISEPEVLQKAAVNAVNKVTDRTYDLARRGMNEGINLDDDYIRRRLRVQHADTIPRATITADGNNVVLGRYNPKMVMRPVRNVARAKGDAKRGIAPGLRAGGVTVEVTRGAPKLIQTGFLLPLKRGTEAGGNGIGVFTRERDGSIKHRYGPSVYQLFLATTEQLINSEIVQDDLQETALDELELAIQKALE